MQDFDRKVRQLVYERFATTGTAPSVEEIATDAATTMAAIEGSLRRLETAHALALAPTSNRLWMAHPFSAVPTAYTVETDKVTYWANCAWDAVSIPPLLGLDATVPAKCPDCGESLRLEFREGALVEGEGLVHFVVPPKRFWENVGFT